MWGYFNLKIMFDVGKSGDGDPRVDSDVTGGAEVEAPDIAGDLEDLKKEVAPKAAVVDSSKGERDSLRLGQGAEAGKVAGAGGDKVAEMEAMAEKYADTKSVLDKLKYLRDEGKITPEQYGEFVEALSRLKPDCWRGIRFVSFKIPVLNRLSSITKISLDDDVSNIDFVHDITRNAWDKMLTNEQKTMIEGVHDSLSKQERMATHWKKHPRASYFIQGGNEEEWFCQAFACLFTKADPYYTNIIQHPKLQPVVQLFESFMA